MLRTFYLLFALILLSCYAPKIKDGIYEGKSQSHYTKEPYVGFVKIEMKNDKIMLVDFQIIDTLHNEVFGSDYEKHYPNNEKYQQQCRNDFAGMNTYTLKLMEKQNIDSVDAISGATWSHNLFTASVKQALSSNK